MQDAATTFWRGRRVTFAAFSSSSLDLAAAADRAGNGGTVLEIHALEARLLEGLSCFAGEQEVLILPMTPFAVISAFKEVVDPATGLRVHVISLQGLRGEEYLS